ncbi:MAG TPA: YbaK/EbsC family protein, partial [bacterium]|nr:YbaK/EbsC family protein [bacterium]
MLQSRLYIPTRRETPHDTESRGQSLLIRAGFIRQLPSGVRAYLPIGEMILQRLRGLMRKELQSVEAMEVHVPYGEFEEMLISLVGGDLRSYRDLPKVFFAHRSLGEGQFLEVCAFGGSGSTPTPALPAGSSPTPALPASGEGELLPPFTGGYRGGLLQSFRNVFHRIGLDVIETGGQGTTWGFAVRSDEGTTFGTCAACGFSMPLTMFPLTQPEISGTDPAALEKVHTPGMTKVEQVTQFLGCSAEQLIKTMIFQAGEECVAVLLRGDHTVSEEKLSACLGCPVQLATPEMIERVTGAPVGFAGPVGLEGILKIADWSVRNAGPCVTGANEADYHYRGVTLGRDYQVDRWADLRVAQLEDVCGNCGDGRVKIWNGIELARGGSVPAEVIERLEAWYMDENGARHP